MIRNLAIVLAGLVIVLGAGFVAYLLVGADEPPGPVALDASAPDAPPPNAIARQAGEWGIETCAREIALVSDFLTRNTVFSARSMRGPHEPDGEAFSATIVSRAQGSGIESMSTMTVAPVSAGRCNVIYETTSHFASDCEATRQARFPNFVNPIAFGGLARVYGTAEDDGQLYMLPAGSGCLVKKTQILY